MEPVPTQKRERREGEEPEAEEDVEVIVPEPPQEAQRENIPTEEVMCPGCGANLVSGTIVCPACNTNITGTSEVKRGILAKRRELLNKLGYKYLDADTIERIGSQSKQFREESARGNRSPEGDYVGTARQQLKRAIGLGYTSMADRYENDVQFVERMTEHNITLLDIQLRDIVAHGHLPMPPRTRAQVDLGVGMRTANDLDFAKLMYVDEDIADITSSDPGLLERFEHSHWVIIWQRELYSLKEFQDLCDHRKTRGKGTNLLTFTCVMEIVETPSMRELHETIDSSLPVAQQLLQNKRHQSERAAERNAAKGRGKASRAHVAASVRNAHAVAPKTPPKAAPSQRVTSSAEPEGESSPSAGYNAIGLIDIHQRPTAKFPPSPPTTLQHPPAPKTPPIPSPASTTTSKSVPVRDAREGALRTARAAAREYRDGDRWGYYTFYQGQWWTRDYYGRWSTGNWRSY